MNLLEDKNLVRDLLKHTLESDSWMEAKTKYSPIIETDAALDKIVNRILPLIGEEETARLEDAVSRCENTYSELGLFFGLLMGAQAERDLTAEKEGKLVEFNPKHPDGGKGRGETDGNQ